MILTILTTNRLYEDNYWVVLMLFTVLATFFGVGLLLIRRKFWAVLGIMLAVILNFSINYWLNLDSNSKINTDLDLISVIVFATFPFFLSFLQIIL
jgi:predicted cobalt transporter CbtA